MITNDTQPEPRREPHSDHLLTPENCTVVLIDYQPEQYSTVTSASAEEITLNAVTLCKLATCYRIPVILTTVAVDMGVNQPTVAALRAELPGVTEIDRTGVNAWENPHVRHAIEDEGRTKVVIAGLWTEVCLTFPVLDLLAAGYDVYPVADAVGGISNAAHERAFDRMIAAGARPITAIAFGCELMRDWARTDADNLRAVMRWYFPERRRLALA